MEPDPPAQVAERGHEAVVGGRGHLHLDVVAARPAEAGVGPVLPEVRRRTKVIGRFPGETSCLTMAWAVMDLVIAGGKGLGLTLDDRRAIAAIVAERAAPSAGRQVAWTHQRGGA